MLQTGWGDASEDGTGVGQAATGSSGSEGALMRDSAGHGGAVDAIRKLDHTLRQRESLLRAVSDVAGQMLELGSWDGIEKSLRRLGESIGVERVSILKNRTDASGRVLMSLNSEWSDTGVEPQFGKPRWQDMHWPDIGLSEWQRRLEAGQPLAVTQSDQPPGALHQLERQGILSLAAVPIVVRDEWWGTLVFDDCRTERSWPDAELDALQTVARVFASFILRVRNENSLRESEARYRDIVMALPDFIFRLDSSFRFIDVQTIFPEELHIPREQFIGRNLREVVPPDVAAIGEEQCRATLESGQIQISGFEMDVRGELRHFETRLVPSADQGLLAIVRDVTEAREAERRLRESEARYNAVVNDQTELICRFRPDSVLTFVNEAYCRYFGRTEEELLGNRFMPMVPEEDQDLVTWMFSSLNKAQPLLVYEHRVYDAAGDIRWVEWTDRLIMDENGEIFEYQSVGRDVTERKDLQQRLLSSAENEQKRLAQELHDGLCQDLKGLEIEATLLEDGLADGDPVLLNRAAEVGRLANLAVRSAYDMIRGMLPVGLDAAGFGPALMKLVERARDQAGCRIELSLCQGLLPVSEIQANNLYRIALEALGNAMRHAKAAEILLSWAVDGDVAVLSIRDDGIGFDAARPRWENSGLGLTVLESRAQAIRARLRIESSPGRGTEIRCLVNEWSLPDRRSG